MSTHTHDEHDAAPLGRTAPDQTDNHRLTGHQKSLIGMAIVGNVSEFFDMFLIGFIVNLLIETPGWSLTGFHPRAPLACAVGQGDPPVGVLLVGAGLVLSAPLPHAVDQGDADQD